MQLTASALFNMEFEVALPRFITRQFLGILLGHDPRALVKVIRPDAVFVESDGKETPLYLRSITASLVVNNSQDKDL